MSPTTTLSLTDALLTAQAYLQQQRYAEADELCKHILDAVPNQPEALRLRGLAAYYRQDFESAVKLVSQAVALDPNNPEYQDNLAISLKNLGRLSESEQAL